MQKLEEKNFKEKVGRIGRSLSAHFIGLAHTGGLAHYRLSAHCKLSAQCRLSLHRKLSTHKAHEEAQRRS